MPKPYRRRKGKTGPYVGNFRCTFDGRDINLKTKDAHEALARARLVKKGKWPPIDAAVDAAQAALDPGNTDPVPLPEADPGEAQSGAGPHADPPATHPAPLRESEAPSHDPPPSLNEAARAAAEEASGVTGEDHEAQAEQQNHVNEELRAVMAELGGGASGADLLDGLCDGVAAFALWAEAKGIQLGVNWTLAKRKSTVRLVTKQPEQGDLMRKCLRVGLKGAVLTYFPDFATSITPAWAIAIGLTGGAVSSVMAGELVNIQSGQHQPVGEAVAEVRAQAQAAADVPPSQPPAPPAS